VPAGLRPALSLRQRRDGTQVTTHDAFVAGPDGGAPG